MTRLEKALVFFALLTALLACVLAASSRSLAATATHTRDARACLVTGGGVLAGTDGGLVIAPRAGEARVLTALDGLSGTRVHSLSEVGDEIWVGTEKGVTRLGPTLAIVGHLKTAPVRDVLVSGDTVYLATWGQGLVKTTRAAKKAARVPFSWGDDDARRNRATALAMVGQVLHVGTAGRGVYALRGARLRRIDERLKDRLVWSLHAEAETLYVGTLRGLLALDGDALQTLAPFDARAVLGPASVGTFGEAVRVSDGRRWRAYEGLPAEASFVHGLHRRGGTLCAATTAGVWVKSAAEGARWARLYSRSGPPSNDIAALARGASGELWVGTFDKGLARQAEGAWKAVSPALPPTVNAIAFAGDVLWVATARGAHRVAPDGQISAWRSSDGLPSDDVHAVLALDADHAVVGTARGAAIVGAAGVEVLGAKTGMVDRAVWAIARSGGGKLWLGSTVGLYEQTDGGWRRHSVSSGALRDDWITALLFDPEDPDTLWVGTYAQGVTRLRLDGAAPRAAHLGGGYVNVGGLTRAGGRLYAATMDGLLSRPASGSTAWATHTGTLGEDVTAVVAADDGLWIATRRGLSRLRCARPARCPGPGALQASRGRPSRPGALPPRAPLGRARPSTR